MVTYDLNFYDGSCEDECFIDAPDGNTVDFREWLLKGNSGLDIKNTNPFFKPDFDLIGLLKINGFTEYEIPSVFTLLANIRHIQLFKIKVLNAFDCFVHMHTYLIRKCTDWGDNSSKILDRLSRIKVIKRNKSYQVGSYSMSYGLGEVLDGVEWTRVDYEDYIKTFNFNKRVYNRTKLSLWDRMAFYSRKWETLKDEKQKAICRRTFEILKDCSIDVDAADKILKVCAAEKYEQHIAEKKKLGELPSTTYMEILQGYRYMVLLFNSDNPIIMVDPNTGRIYAIQTFIKKEVRPLIRYKGEALVSLDIKCCQPGLLASFYNDSDPDEAAEKEKFIHFVTEEDIYIKIAADQITRKEAKIEMFKVMFAKLFQHTGVFFENFKSLFPVLEKKISNKKYTKGYKSVSKELQTKEANIMIKGVLAELHTKGIIALTVHDSLLVQTKDIKTATETMTKHFMQVMKYKPIITLEQQ